MNLVQMSITAGILIIGITAFRALFIHRVPKKVMVLLWEIAILRLVLPFAVPMPFPGLGDLGAITMDSDRMEAVSLTVGDMAPEILGRMTAQGAGTASLESADVVEISTRVVTVKESYLLWGIYGLVALAMAAGSLYFYFRDSQFFREGLPMPEREKQLLLLGLEEKDRKRLEKVKFRVSDRTASPVTCGVFGQAIVFPKGLYGSTEKEITFWLRHELVHIRHRDNLKKVVAHGVLCLHWFNPLVWLMYLLFNRDMELLCDETVVRRRQESRKDYALALLSMAQQKSIGFQTGLGFGKNAVTERITAVMKFKGMTTKGIVGAVLAVLVSLTVFGSHYVSYAADGKGRTEYYDAVKTGEYTVTMEADAIEGMAVNENPLIFGYTSSYAYDVTQTQDRAEGVQPGTAEAVEGRVASVEEGAETVEERTYTVEETVGAAEAVDSGVREDRSMEAVIDEYRQFGLSVQVMEDDYQLYYEDEPIYFFADSTVPEEEGFSGRLFLREASEKNGKTGVVTQYDGEGKISALRHLSEEESEAYTRRWR